MGIFSKCQIALDLDTSLSFKRKAALKRQIIDNDGVISYIVTRKVGNPRFAWLADAIEKLCVYGMYV